MKPKSTLAIEAATLASVIGYLVTMPGQADESSAPVYVTHIPAGYRDWKVISVASTGGWGFGHFNADGKPATEAVLKTRLPCHEPAKAGDSSYTHYTP